MNPHIPDSPTPMDEALGDVSRELRANLDERRWYYHAFRQAFGRGGSAYALSRNASNNEWRLECVLPDTSKRSLALLETYEEALRVMDYCVHRDTAVKLALIELYENANPDPLERLINDGKVFGELPRRRMRFTVTVDVEMRGTDTEIISYLEAHLRHAGTFVKAAKVTGVEGPRLEEPRPMREDEING